MYKLKFIALKELYHILRDSRSLTIAIIMPIMMTFLYGYAVNLDVNNIVISVIDYDQSFESHELIDRFYESTYFSKPQTPVDATNPQEILRTSDANAVLIIKPGFGKAVGEIRRGEKELKPFSLGMIIDGSDNNLSAAVQNYSNFLVNEYIRNLFPPGVKVPGINISREILYNPDLKSAYFFVPGLVAIVLLMISALLTSITIAREKETGTMEQLLTAPVSPFQILLGKILPYVFLALLDGVLVLMFAKILFDVPFAGSKLLLLGFGLIYVATSLSIGILISSLVKTQQVAMMFAVTVTVLPSVMLSGFIFAIRNMPLPLQLLTYVIPARYFIVIIRGILLKGAGFEVLASQGLYLIILMTVLIFIAAKNFKTRVD
ncbi:MAG: ABC transporter permease [FCB group bacterium]|nr:ABC transporter permease [FCB group bacterium]